jgi:two-component system, chemotaxis family, sensor kinase CheA
VSAPGDIQGDDLTARLRATFLQELQEQVRELNGALLELEQRPGDGELVRTLFRSAHTIKGAARVAGAPAIEEACHTLESVFDGLRSGDRNLVGADFSLLFATFDALGEAGRALRGGDVGSTDTLRALLPRLHAMSLSQEPVAQPARAAAGTPPAPATGGATEARPEPPPAPDRPTRATPQQQRGAEPAASAGAVHEASDDLVRIAAERLDTLMSAVGELLIATGRIVERSAADDVDVRRLEQTADDVAGVARRLRLRPFADACDALPRAVRDIAAAAGKEARLELAGLDVEADRMVIDALRDPLLHLVRNAVDHGIEPPDERERRGKPRVGTVTVRAELRDARLVVTVSDDGAGIDEQAVRAAMRRRGRAEPRSRAELEDAVLAGGFSTRTEASEISGRGVGVDLVRSAVERIGGSVDVEWNVGGGTMFVLACPPTPATIRALLVRVGPYLFAVPTAHVERIRRLKLELLRNVEGALMLPTPRGPITVHPLASLLGPPLEARPIDGSAPAVIVVSGSRRAALIVDETIAEDEIVVRPLDVGDRNVPFAAGAAVLPSGRIALVLGMGALLSGAARAGTTIAPVLASRGDAPQTRILVADDSITTRTLERSVLEAAGYTVATAVDGEDAWRQLERDGADLLVADVEMPRMDGIALCRRIRASERLRELPVVLVTGLATDADRARGLEAGADAYIVKSSFDHASLLETVRQLTGSS